METEITIREYNGGENLLQLALIEQLGEVGYVQQLYDFLQGKFYPESIKEDDGKPNLTSEQAWDVIYCMQEHFGLLDQRFERCDKCGDIFDSYNEGVSIYEDSELRIVEDDDGNEVEKSWEKSQYGIYCDSCRPD